MPQNASAYLTGDGNVVLLNATLIYRINDPIAYALSQTHVAAGAGSAVPRRRPCGSPPAAT